MESIKEIIAAAPWRFAKTMPQMPHEYVVEGKSLDPVSFDALAAHIAGNGFSAAWWGRTNTYLEYDGWRYWVMPGRGDESIRIINREMLPGQPLRKAEDGAR
jgi:hypothetical protein